MERARLAWLSKSAAGFLALWALGACGHKIPGGPPGPGPVKPCQPDESASVPTREKPGEWQRVDIPGAVCSNGSQYAVFVNYSSSSNNLILMLEPGGACWDYASCSPEGGLRGAVNANGLPPGIEHMNRFQFLPLLRPDAETNPIHTWNKVFIPYCTGDIHAGNKTATYTGPNGESLVFRHNGHDNIQRTVVWLNQTFKTVPRLFVTGCSAGGAGAAINYHFIRSGMTGSQCGYMLDDSGPLFPSAGPSKFLHDKVRQAWNIDPILDGLAPVLARVGVTPNDIKTDVGRLNTALADLYPRDRLGLSVYRRDLNYSLYSYESFYDFPPYTKIHELWEQDLTAMRKLFATRKNLAYYMPFFRIDNCSHCVSIPPIGLDGKDQSKPLLTPWLGSEIQAESLNMRDYAVLFLDDSKPLQSYLETEQAGEGFTPAEAAVCEDL
jgi:hypothetical protein